ncbi:MULTISPECIES: helix-turn-helix transcriptional regulator [unclassified Rhizobium]|uniref:helix-turn-helix transcriptional regulator n=1 Tax=unclassified Rhizobium TaxID=2613769 RepID=UPI00247B25A6|nr:MULTISPECIES: helix-turn-helix transcriptional regulator [unclassified Rhizobium]MDH7800754.1 AraC-like DNA-binding protein [Rhizobium sp. AN70]
MEHQSNSSRQVISTVPDVSILPITQATAATFTDLFIGLTFLCFIRSGTKRVICPVQGELIAGEGDLLIFPSGSMVTLENRPLPNADYRADGVYFADDMVDAVFAHLPRYNTLPGIQLLRAASHGPSEILDLIRETLDRDDLPPPIRRHRLLEPLIWLQHNGVQLPIRQENQPWSKLRSLIETDVSKPWRIAEVARHFATSEATFRRQLVKSGLGFAQILLNTRLEKGLALLQTTQTPISQVALECGFKTPSHFSDAFRKRFGIKPKLIRLAEN